MEKIEKQLCPVCSKRGMTLSETELEVPYFGKVYLFAMVCSECGFRKSDIEPAEEKEPARYSLEIKDTKDLSIRIVKSSNAKVNFPELKITVEPGVSSEGFVANVEKLLNDAYEMVKFLKENEEDAAKRKKAWKLMDKILDIKEGKDSVTLIIEDPTGASAIISEKAKKEPLKKKK